MRNILDFPGQFSPPARVITLDHNYRSTQAILTAANGVIDLAKERFTKNLWTDRASGAKPELSRVATRPTRRAALSNAFWKTGSRHALKQQAVLFRTSQP